MDRFNRNRVGGDSSGKNSKQRRPLLSCRPNHRNIARMCICRQQKMLILRKRKHTRPRARTHTARQLAIVDAVKPYRVSTLIRDPEHAVIAAHNPLSWPVANRISPPHFVSPRSNLREAVRIKVRNEDLSAVRLHRKMNRRLPNIKQRQHTVGRKRWILFGRPRSRRRRKTNRHHLMSRRAGHKGLRGVRQNDGVGSSLTTGRCRTKMQGGSR